MRKKTKMIGIVKTTLGMTTYKLPIGLFLVVGRVGYRRVLSRSVELLLSTNLINRITDHTTGVDRHFADSAT